MDAQWSSTETEDLLGERVLLRGNFRFNLIKFPSVTCINNQDVTSLTQNLRMQYHSLMPVALN